LLTLKRKEDVYREPVEEDSGSEEVDPKIKEVHKEEELLRKLLLVMMMKNLLVMMMKNLKVTMMKNLKVTMMKK